MNTMMSSINSGLSDTTAQYLFGVGTKDELMDALKSPEGFAGITQRLLDNIYSLQQETGGDEIALSTLMNELGFDRDMANAVITASNIAKKSGNSLDVMNGILEKIEGYEGASKELEEVAEKDYYVTATKGWDNVTENMVTELAVESTYIPHFDELFSGVTTILSNILSAVFAVGSANVLSGASGLGGGALGAAGKVGAVGAAAVGGYAVGNLIGKGIGKAMGVSGIDTGYFGEEGFFSTISKRGAEKSARGEWMSEVQNNNVKLQDKNARAWYQYFDDPAFVGNYLGLVADQNDDGLPDNPAVGQAFYEWRHVHKDEGYTISDYMRDNNLISGSHAFGLSYVPHDDYLANLHEGETVLSKRSADALRALQQLGVPSAAVADINSKGISDKISLVTKAIENQTEELIARLDIIIEGMTMSRPSGVSASSVY